MLIDAINLGYDRQTCRSTRLMPTQFFAKPLFSQHESAEADATPGGQGLDGVNFSLAPGEMLALLGHNGAGKSTLIKLLLGLIAPSRGSLKVLGNVPKAGMAGVGYLPEHCRLYPKLTGKELLELFCELKGESPAAKANLIESFSLEPLLDKPCGSLSKGQLQRLALALALTGRPRLLLLDEPTTGLDPGACEFMYHRLDELKQRGTGLVICTHDLSLIEPRCDKALFIAAGTQRAMLPASELTAFGGLRAAYGQLIPATLTAKVTP